MPKAACRVDDPHELGGVRPLGLVAVDLLVRRTQHLLDRLDRFAARPGVEVAAQDDSPVRADRTEPRQQLAHLHGADLAAASRRAEVEVGRDDLEAALEPDPQRDVGRAEVGAAVLSVDREPGHHRQRLDAPSIGVAQPHRGVRRTQRLDQAVELLAREIALLEGEDVGVERRRLLVHERLAIGPTAVRVVEQVQRRQPHAGDHRLRRMGIAPRAATVDDVMAGLTEDGYALVEDVLAPEDVARTRADLTRVLGETPTGRNDFEGFETRRIYALFAKTRAFDDRAIHPLLLGVLDRVLGHYQLSAPTGIQIGPGEVGPDPPPRRLDLSAARAAPGGRAQHDVAVRRLHHRERRHPHRPGEPPVGAGPAPDRRRRRTSCRSRCRPGRSLFYTGSIWHGGGANRTDRPRLGVILEYVVVVAAGAGEPRARPCRGRWWPSCPSGSRSCSATTSIRRSWATSTGAIPAGS